MHTGSSWGNLKERDHWECQSIDGRITIKCNVKGKNEDGSLYWIELAQNRDKWRANETSGSIKCRRFLNG